MYLVQMILAEETIWQQQEGTLWSIEGTLTTIAVLIGIGLLLALIIGATIATRTGRLIRIARATHDLLEEGKKANQSPEKADPPSREATAGREVYRID